MAFKKVWITKEQRGSSEETYLVIEAAKPDHGLAYEQELSIDYLNLNYYNPTPDVDVRFNPSI